MNITLYKISEDKRVVAKTISVSNTITTYNSAEIKFPCNMFNPVIILPYYSDATKTSLNANYMYIDDFARYYYINKIELENQRLIFYCTVDVLKSFASEITSMYGYISRNEKLFNLYVPDKHFTVRGDRNIQMLEFTGGQHHFTKHNDMSFVLTVAGQS